AAVRGEGRSYILGERVPLAMGIAGWVARFREMLELKGEVNDPRFAPIHPRPEIRHALSVPMLAGNDFVGVLNVNLIRQRRPFTLRDVKALSILAGLGAAALQNARLLAQVRAGEKRFRALIENASDAIALVSADGTILYESPSVTRVLGYAVGERTGQLFIELIHPDDLPDITQRFAQLLRQPGAIVGAQLRYRHKDGSWRWLESTGQNLLAEPGVEAIVANYRDITERRMAQDALRENEDRYRDLIEHIHDLICTHDLEGQILSANQSASKMSGYAPHELVGKNLRDILAPEVRHEFDNYLSTIQQKGAAHGLMLVETRSGERRIWEYDNSLRIEGVSAPIVRGFARDITERKRAEETIRQAEQRYRQLFEEAPAMYVITRNQEGGPVVADCNELFLTTSGYTRAEVVGQPLADFYTPASRAKMLAGGYQRALKGEFLSEEREFVGRDGRIIETLLRTMPEVAPDGQITGTRAMYVDVTERKQAEEALRLQSAALNAAANSIMITNRDGAIEWVNPAFTTITGYTAEEAIGKNPRELVKSGKHSPEFYKDLWDAILAGEVWRGELINRRKDGSHYSEEQTITPLRDARGEITHFIAIQQDITERKRQEEALKLFRTLINRSSDAIEVLDPETGRFLDVNEKGCLELGYSREEFLALSVFDVDPMVDQSVFTRVMEELRKSGVLLWEGFHRRKDGSTFPVEVNMKYVRLDRDYIVTVARDITERKQVDEALRSNEIRFP
ncbi:MAG: PAS domain S-box protein, partial [Anaerolineales bacterium]|nr:PAS domain S-box protein [Anaerolineales bacterium]